jgi:hypothetical protein
VHGFEHNISYMEAVNYCTDNERYSVAVHDFIGIRLVLFTYV